MRTAACLVVALAVLPAPARAGSPAVRYNDPVPVVPRAPLERRIETLVADIAQKMRREPPRPDPRLAEAASELVRRMPADGRPPNDMVQAALWLHGVVEPPPHLIVVTMGRDSEAEMLEELRGQLPRALAQGRYRRVAAAIHGAGDEIRVIVALQESALELEPVPRALLHGGPAPLKGRLRAPFQRPEAFVTAPDGQVTRLPLDGDATTFSGTFRCGPDKGRYQVELNGDDRYGATVLANFPVYCGVAAPAVLDTRAAPPEEKFTDAAAAEATLHRLVNADRARAGLPALAPDARLTQIARAHSADMQAHGFVGHVSPSTGSAADRIRKAAVDAQLIMENVARAYSPSEAERGLMESPGHRANILNREATHVGIGVVAADGVGGVKELLVTQLFIRPPDKLGPQSKDELRRRIDELRRQKGLKPLGSDATLDQVSQSTAEDLARGRLTAERAGEPMDRALGRLAGKYRSVRSVVASAGGPSQVLGGLTHAVLDPTATTLGIGLGTGKRPDGSAVLYAVIVLATGR
ncbi:MAG TPA: CAP domain-containing protein [Kofleriaceae bacterium]|nr:CAP domain-containing protein [Kofleriaceae bacterium]